jgi:hypothetical protein
MFDLTTFPIIHVIAEQAQDVVRTLQAPSNGLAGRKARLTSGDSCFADAAFLPL